MHTDLTAFLEHARSRGLDHATIRMLLLSAGWKEKDVAKALAEHALALPVPAPPDAGGARDAFLHVSAFAALYTAAIASISLLFQLIHRLFPDPAFRLEAQEAVTSLQGVRWSLAFVLVAFPVFLFVSRLLLREIRAQAEKSWSPVRRWLTYLTLFLAATTLGADFITLVYFFLEGEISARFLVKVAAVAIVAGMVFAYYLRTVRMPAATLAASRMHRGFAGAASLLSVGIVVWGFVVAGSPAAERLRKLDERRVHDLRTIEAAVERICLGREPGETPEMNRPLPASLAEVAAESPGERPAVRDPGGSREYEYTPTGETTYEICAVFDRVRDVSWDARWNHPAGRHCFEIDVLRPE